MSIFRKGFGSNRVKTVSTPPHPKPIDKVLEVVDALNKIGANYKISFKGFTYECNSEPLFKDIRPSAEEIKN